MTHTREVWRPTTQSGGGHNDGLQPAAPLTLPALHASLRPETKERIENDRIDTYTAGGAR